MQSRHIILVAGLAGATAVACGAFGAHSLRLHLTELGTFETWKTAVLYHLVHALGLLGLAVWSRVAPDKLLGISAWLWSAGLLCFSGSLYWTALGGPRWLWPLPPLGGSAFIAGWVLVGVQAWRQPKA